MISDFETISELFKEMDEHLKHPVHLFIIGGAMLLHYGIKPATKDVDIVVQTENEFCAIEDALEKMGFESRFPSLEYKKMNINQILVREDFRIDLFQKTVCRGFSLSEGMIKRARKIITLKYITASLCSNEDVFLLKTLTEREGDLEDCISLAQRGINWEIVLKELKHQIGISKSKIWFTWVGERLDILEERGLNIPIMAEIDKLREDYFSEYEKS